VCGWQPRAAHAELEDVSRWQQAPVRCWHLGRAFGGHPCWRRSRLRGYRSRYPVDDLEQLPGGSVFLPDARSPALRAWESGAGCWRRGHGSVGTGRAELVGQTGCFSPCPMRPGCRGLCLRRDQRIAFRLWLQGGVGGETLCLFYDVSLYHST